MNDSYQKLRTEMLIKIAIFSALVMATTMIFKIDTAYGYLNMGDLVIMSLAVLFPVRSAAIAAGVGSALADIFSGYPHYAAFTFFIKITEVLIIHVMKRSNDRWVLNLGFVCAGLSMVALYGVADMFMTTSTVVFIPSVLANLPQAVICSVGAILMYPLYIKAETVLKGLKHESK